MFLRDEPGTLLKLLADLKAGTLADMKVDLYKNSVLVTRTNVVGDFTIANYNSYSGGVVTWNDPSLALDGTPEMVGTVPEFRPGSDATANQCYGIYCRADADSALLYAAPFDGGPKRMATVDDAIVVTVRARIKGNSLVVLID